MILELTVGNYRSIKEPVTLSMEAASISDSPENVFAAGKHTLLKSAVVYGANASGKSNLLIALAEMRHIVCSSSRMTSTDEFGVTPFLLNTKTVGKPSFFEALFLIEGVRYRYGFELSPEKVHTEWLYQSKASAEKPLFIRDGEAIEVSAGRFPEGKNLESKTRENALFLSVCDQFNGDISKKIMEWFSNGNTILGLSHENYRGITFQLLKDPEYRPAMLEFLEQLDLGFEVDMPASSGTAKLLDMLGLIFQTLRKGGVLAIDDLDANLHILLTRALAGLFHSNKTNIGKGQLIFTVHQTNLLSDGGFRRDQIYFTEKNKEGATVLYSLIEYKEEGGVTVRKDRSFEKDYLQGRYGAIPYLNVFSND